MSLKLHKNTVYKSWKQLIFLKSFQESFNQQKSICSVQFRHQHSLCYRLNSCRQWFKLYLSRASERYQIRLFLFSAKTCQLELGIMCCLCKGLGIPAGPGAKQHTTTSGSWPRIHTVCHQYLSAWAQLRWRQWNQSSTWACDCSAHHDTWLVDCVVLQFHCWPPTSQLPLPSLTPNPPLTSLPFPPYSIPSRYPNPHLTLEQT